MDPYLTMAGADLIGTGLGMATANWNDKRQLEQQGKLQQQQIKGAKQLSDYQKAQSLDIWNKTNYEAQVAHMKAAGLNVGLMYGGGGAGGGTTSGANITMPSSSAAPSGGHEMGMGMQLGIAAAQAAANLELTKATAKKTEVEANKIAGVDTTKAEAETAKIGVDVEAIKQGITNAKIQGQIMQWDAKLKEIETNVSSQTQEEVVKQIQNANKLLSGQIESAAANGEIDQATKNDKIKQIQQSTTEQSLRISAQKLGLVKTGEEIKALDESISKMAAEINNMSEQQKQNWLKLDQNEREIFIKKTAQEQQWKVIDMQTNTAAKIKQWTDIYTSIIGANTGAIKAAVGMQ